MTDNNFMYVFIYFMIIIILFMFIYYSSYFYSNIFVIEELKSEQMEVMEQVEKTYEKKYPIGNDFFKINHYPKYTSFFEQFNNYKYLVKKNKNKITSTCCFANIYTDIYYICDLKKIGQEKNQAYNFVAYAYIMLGIRKLFGIVMEPNPVINNLIDKYGFIKIEQLNLYKIKFNQIKNNIDIINKIFSNFYITSGFKKFILESNKTELKCYHIAHLNDCKITIKPVESILFEKIKDEDDIMFCINTKSNFNYLLELKNIFPTNKMSIIANKQIIKEEFDFDLIKTYMI